MVPLAGIEPALLAEFDFDSCTRYHKQLMNRRFPQVSELTRLLPQEPSESRGSEPAANLCDGYYMALLSPFCCSRYQVYRIKF
jgi:hypothetical protein